VQYARQAFPDIVSGEGEVFLLEGPVLLRPFIDGAGKGRLEAGEVGAALVRIDVIDEREGVLVVALVVLDGPFDFDALAPRFEDDRLRVQRLAACEQIFYELCEASIVNEGLFFLL
jgi:hypothetical protein